MPNIPLEGYVWAGVIVGTLLVAGIAVGLSSREVGLEHPMARILLGGLAVLAGLLAVLLIWVRTANFSFLSVVAVVVALVGGRNLLRSINALERGERPLSPAERHVRSLAREVYNPWLEEANLRLTEGVAHLELRLNSDAPVQTITLNLTSLAEKHEGGMSDEVVRKAMDFTRKAGTDEV